MDNKRSSLTARQERLAKMISMRDEGKTLEEIGIAFGGISRERVRQLIGNTGKDYRRNLLIEKIKSSSADEIDKAIYALGYSRRIKKAIGFDNPRERINGGSREAGQHIENVVSEKLKSIGIDNMLMSNNHPFDMLIGNKRVDIKSSWGHTRENNKDGWKFMTNKRKKGDYTDFFICVIVPLDEYYIIPNSMAPKDVILIVSPAKKKSIWDSCKDNFDLLR